jgi:hypothetical protein
MTAGIRVIASSLLIMGGGSVGDANITDASTPSVTLGENNTIRLPVDAIEGTRKVLVVLNSIPPGPAPTAAPTIRDTNMDGGATVLFHDKPDAVQTEGARAWVFTATISGLPLNSGENHLATVSLDNKTYMRSYTLTNRPGGTATWSIAVPTVPWIRTWETSSSPLTVTVSTQDVPISGLMIAQSTLRDAQGLTQIDRSDLELVSDTADGFSVPAHTTRAFDVRLKWRGHYPPPHGKFAGNIQLGARNMPDVQTGAVTLYASSLTLRTIGALFIYIGLRLSRSLVQRIKPRIARAQALKLVILARKSGSDLAAELTRLAVAGQKYDSIRERLEKIGGRLATKRLDDEDLLPHVVGLPFGAVDSTARLQERLNAVGTELAAVATVSHNGIQPAVNDLNSGSYDKQGVQDALKDLDALGAAVGTPADALAQIAPVLAKYRATGGAVPTAMAAAIQAATQDPVTIQQANQIIEHETQAGWLIAEVVTLAAGFVLLVLPNAGFAWVDLAYCLLWGLGLPTAGAAFQSLTPTGIATDLGLAVPRT